MESDVDDARFNLVASKSIRSHGSVRSPAPWMAALAESVRARRKALGLTQVQLADLARCGPVLIYAIESAKTTVRLDKLVDVLSVLGLQLRVEPGKGNVMAPSR
jgi:y4mF family transcriptional regulator